MTGPEAADSAPVPTSFTARTWKVYVVPFVSPVTTRAGGRGIPTTV